MKSWKSASRGLTLKMACFKRKKESIFRKNFRSQSVYTYQASEKQNDNFRVMLTLIPTWFCLEIPLSSSWLDFNAPCNFSRSAASFSSFFWFSYKSKWSKVKRYHEPRLHVKWIRAVPFYGNRLHVLGELRRYNSSNSLTKINYSIKHLWIRQSSKQDRVLSLTAVCLKLTKIWDGFRI